jgi:hypothetical protein
MCKNTNTLLGFPYHVFAIDDCMRGWMNGSCVCVCVVVSDIFHYPMNDRQFVL